MKAPMSSRSLASRHDHDIYRRFQQLSSIFHDRRHRRHADDDETDIASARPSPRRAGDAGISTPIYADA